MSKSVANLIGKKAPDFNLEAVIDNSFKIVQLNDYCGKYLVVLFYPLDFTFVCPTELVSFNDSLDKFKKLNCEVVAVSTDSKYSHLKWNQMDRKKGGLGNLTMPLLADYSKKMAQDYGVLFEDGPDEGVALRGLFIIDDKGILRQVTANDLPVGRSVDETLRLVEAFQFTDKHGEVCPANWKKGSKTMKDNPIDSQEYFNEL